MNKTTHFLHSTVTRRSLLSTLFIMLATICFAEKITFSADSMIGSASDKSDYTKLEGNAVVKTESMEIAADTIELKGEDFRYIIATGTIKGSNTESKLNFTCDKMTYDRDTKIATFENTVHLVDAEHDVTADAQLIEYNQNTEIAVMQIGVSLKQKDNTCTSAYAIYRKSAQLLDMSGNPKIIQGDNTFRAQTITLNLDTQEITLDGRVQGSVSSKGNTSSDKKDTTGATPSEAGATTSEAGTTPSGTSSTTTDSTKAASATTATTSNTAADSTSATNTTTSSAGSETSATTDSTSTTTKAPVK